MKKKFYTVIIGRKTGVFKTWQECKDQIDGYSGASFKSFVTEKEAEDFLRGGTSNTDVPNPIDTLPIDAEIYTDGSWNSFKMQYGWGFVVVKNGQPIYEKNGKGNNPKYIGSRQIGGEVAAVLQGIDYAIYKGYKHVKICYDYEGIEKWTTGEWFANAEIASAYVYLLGEKRKEITISFCKVKAHAGDRFNNMADKQAKKGAKL